MGGIHERQVQMVGCLRPLCFRSRMEYTWGLPGEHSEKADRWACIYWDREPL